MLKWLKDLMAPHKDKEGMTANNNFAEFEFIIWAQHFVYANWVKYYEQGGFIRCKKYPGSFVGRFDTIEEARSEMAALAEKENLRIAPGGLQAYNTKWYYFVTKRANSLK